MKDKLFDYHVIHADETLVKVRKDSRPAGSKSYMWVYHTIDREINDITVAGCWAHTRQGLADVIKAWSKDNSDFLESVAYKALQIIQTIYRYEKVYTDKSAEERKPYEYGSVHR